MRLRNACHSLEVQILGIRGGDGAVIVVDLAGLGDLLRYGLRCDMGT